jgi:formylglycine-generating enzyme required for sulfatase activity
MYYVSWDETQDFLSKLNQQSGKTYRLPTEAEWEYAARAGSAGVFPGNPEDLAWSSQNSGRQTHPVGQKQPNAWGLYDMMGNVWEWVSDWYDPAYYGTSPTIDPMGPPSGLSHVARGGSAAQSPLELRSAHRGGINNYMNNTTTMLYGFRIVREPAQ